MRNLLLAAFALGMGVTAASGAVTKITSFAPAGAGIAENPRVDGMASINMDAHVEGSRVHMFMEGLLPNEVYGVAIYHTDNPGFEADFVQPLGLVATLTGSGTIDLVFPTVDLGAHPMIQVFIWDGDAQSIPVITDEELRAEGAAD